MYIKTIAETRARKMGDAEQTLADLMRFSKAEILESPSQLLVYRAASRLRSVQRSFFQAESIERQTIDILKKLNYANTDTRVTDARRYLAMILIGQHRYPEALAEFQTLDQLASDNISINDDSISRKYNVLFNVNDLNSVKNEFCNTK